MTNPTRRKQQKKSSIHEKDMGQLSGRFDCGYAALCHWYYMGFEHRAFEQDGHRLQEIADGESGYRIRGR